MRVFARAMEYLKLGLGILLLMGVGLNLLNVTLRYVWGRPFAWTEEAMTFGLLFIVMAGTVVATAYDENLKIDILVQSISARWQSALRIFAHCVWIGVAIYLAFQSWTVVALMMRFGQTSMAMRLPTWIPHSFLFAAFILSVFAAAYAVIRELRGQGPADRSVASGTMQPEATARRGEAQ